MPILHDYSQFNGRHWETGSVHNVLAYQGIEVPETGQPISEAMLMGISGGAAFGYFIFEYKGSDPYVSLLSRNTFDPLDTLLERLAIPQDLFHTTDASKGEHNLIDVLEGGRPAIVWRMYLACRTTHSRTTNRCGLCCRSLSTGTRTGRFILQIVRASRSQLLEMN